MFSSGSQVLYLGLQFNNLQRVPKNLFNHCLQVSLGFISISNVDICHMLKWNCDIVVI